MCLASQNWIDCDCQIQLANGPWCKIWINTKIRVFSFVHCNFIDLWASFVSLFPSCFSNAIFEMLLETPCMFHISPLNISDVFIYGLVSSQLFSYINKKLLHAFDDFSVCLDCEKDLNAMDILMVIEDQRHMLHEYFT